MASFGDDATLIKVAVFGIAMSIMATCMVVWYASGNPDYDYDTISAYRAELVEFSGGQLVNDNPWVLTGVYTPFIPSQVDEQDIPDHIEYDNGRGGWLYGSKITTYADLNKSADIHLDKDQKSNQLLTVGPQYEYEYRNGESWWNGGNDYGITIFDANVIRGVVNFFGGNISENYGYEMTSGAANNWNYTGYRYVFDPTLPFSNNVSSKDGRLSVVWYDIGDDTGLSGALEVYGGSDGEQILLGRYSAYDIIQAFQSSMGYVQTFDFDFEGTHLNLTVRFDPTVYTNYGSLLDAWNAGAWSMAISSVSAGNFFDVENSNAFSITTGTVFDTFISIYTFDYPELGDSWSPVILWLLVGLPMTIALACLSLRLVGGVFKIF